MSSACAGQGVVSNVQSAHGVQWAIGGNNESEITTLGVTAEQGCLSNGNCGFGLASASLQNGVGVSSAYATSGTQSGGNPGTILGQAATFVGYYFEVTGKIGIPVPLVFTAVQNSWGSGDYDPSLPNSFTRVELRSPQADLSDTMTCLGASAQLCQSFTGLPSTTTSSTTDFNFLAKPGSEFVIQMWGMAASTGNGRFGADIDPSVSFADGFDATGYALELSPNTAAVPEPSELSLFAIGLLTFGLALSRRRVWGW